MKRKKFSIAMPKGFSRPIQLATLVLNAFGILMVVSASMSTRYASDTKDLLFAGGKETIFFIVSYFLMVFMARYFKMSTFKKYFPLLLFGIIIALLLPRIPKIGGEVNGAYAWIHVGPFTLQPSEFAKIFIILMIALFLGDKYHKKITKLRELWTKPITIIFIIVLLVTLYQKDLGSAVVISGISYVCFIIPSHNKARKVQRILLALLFLGLFLMLFISGETGLSVVEKILNSVGADPYMLNRFHTSANPFEDKYGSALQVYNGLAAFTNGGFWGTGIGNGFIKLSYLPEAQSDFILAVLIEETGMIGFLIVFLCYATISYQLIKYALLVRNEQDKIILIGSIAYLLIHFIFNVGGVTALIPLTGVPLLLLSAGGSSKMAIMLMLGICQHVIARYKREELTMTSKYNKGKTIRHENR